MHEFLIYELPSGNDDVIKYIKKNTIDTQYSRFVTEPQVSNGYIFKIHDTKNKMEIVNDPKLKGKNFYHVVNSFEHIITNNDETKTDINTYSKVYFNIGKNSVNIASRAFYKFWEILIIFDLLPASKSVISSHLAEAPGSFVQALMFFREKFYKESDYSKDEHFTISLDDKGIPSFKKEFKKAYSRVKIYEQDGGDLTSLTSINKFEKFAKKSDLITADGGFIFQNENYQEQEAYRLILGEIITAFKTQKIGGAFVLKIFETYTDISIKIFDILSSVYEKTFIFKPFTSRPSNSERYIICKSFKGIDSSIINKLESFLFDMNEHENIGLYLSDFMENYKVSKKYKNAFNLSSIHFSNSQHISINNIISYINSNNYFGDVYHEYLNKQQEANDFWVQTFYPINNKDFNTIKKNLSDLTKDSIKKTQKELEDYNKIII